MLSDFAIVGSRIVGIPTAWNLKRGEPDCKIVVNEKEIGLARYETSRNSGVIHAGVYYQPGSLKARLCVPGKICEIRRSRGLLQLDG